MVPRNSAAGKRTEIAGLLAAIEVSNRGWAVVAVKPGTKTPIEKWVHGPDGPIGFRDEATLRREWPAGRTAVGVLTEPSGLVDTEMDGPEGLASFAELKADHELPDTFILRTPDGWHYVWAVPDGQAFRTIAGKIATGLAPGLDVRGSGGMFVLYDPAQPQRYIHQDVTPVEIPGWLAGRLLAPGGRSDGEYDPDEPSDARRPLEDHVADCLAAAAGGQHYALLAYVQELQRCEGDDAVVVRRAMATVRQMRVYRRTGPRGGPYTERDVRALLLKGDDRPVADATPEEIALLSSRIVPIRPGRAVRQAPRPFDFSALAKGTWERAQPVYGRRADGQAMFYPGKEHAIYGETESGKDMWLVSVVKGCLEQGYSVIWIDFEEGDGVDIGSRVLNAGLSTELLCDTDFFQYFTPADDKEARAIHRHTVKAVPDVVILDGVTAAYGVFGWQVKENDAATAFRAELVRPLLAVGSATISTDHVTKESANGTKTRTRYALGGVMKLNMVSGAAYLLESKASIVRGGEGASRIWLTKDRPGAIKGNCDAGKDPRVRYAGMLTVKSSGDAPHELAIEIIPPQPETTTAETSDGAEIPPDVMEDVSRIFERAGDAGLSKTAVKSAWRGASARKVPLAIDMLAAGGFLVSAGKSTNGQRLRSAREWRVSKEGKAHVHRTGT
jgi:Bifunctional DNA primase/polymerase, N-terminal